MIMAKKKQKTKTIVFKQKPPRSAYFVGSPQEVPEDKANEYINLGFATDPNAGKKKSSGKQNDSDSEDSGQKDGGESNDSESGKKK